MVATFWQLQSMLMVGYVLNIELYRTAGKATTMLLIITYWLRNLAWEPVKTVNALRLFSVKRKMETGIAGVRSRRNVSEFRIVVTEKWISVYVAAFQYHGIEADLNPLKTNFILNNS